jgi:hypothetical protein
MNLNLNSLTRKVGTIVSRNWKIKWLRGYLLRQFKTLPPWMNSKARPNSKQKYPKGININGVWTAFEGEGIWLKEKDSFIDEIVDSIGHCPQPISSVVPFGKLVYCHWTSGRWVSCWVNRERWVDWVQYRMATTSRTHKTRISSPQYVLFYWIANLYALVSSCSLINET